MGDDGSFKLLVFPGPGVVCATGDIDTYLLAPVTKEDATSGVGGTFLIEAEEIHAIVTMNGHAHRVIRPGEKPESLKFDLKLVKGRSVTGSVSADARVVPGVRSAELRRQGAYDLPVRIVIDEKAGTFTASGLDPRRSNLLVFYQEGQKRAGHVEARSDAKDPSVRLLPWGTVRGRVLDLDGRPVAGASVALSCRDGNGKLRDFKTGPLARPVTADAEGRFQAEGIVPGLSFELHVRVLLNEDAPVLVHTIPGVSVKPGETRDFGDLKVRVPGKE